MPLNIRATRSATIRTRLPLDEVEGRIGAFVLDTAGRAAEAGFTDGSQDGRRFRFGYDHGSGNKHQSYLVTGLVEDGKDWRIVRIRLKAREPWMGWWIFSFIVLLLAIESYGDPYPPRAYAFILLLVLGVFAVTALVLGPDAATTRVSDEVARVVRGSVATRRGWVVPPARE